MKLDTYELNMNVANHLRKTQSADGETGMQRFSRITKLS